MKHLLTAVLAALVVASFAAPGAAAYDSPAVRGESLKSRVAQVAAYDSRAVRGEAFKSRIVQRNSAPVFVPVDEGFHWGDAAIGAAAAFGIATIGAAGVALRRPRRRIGAAH